MDYSIGVKALQRTRDVRGPLSKRFIDVKKQSFLPLSVSLLHLDVWKEAISLDLNEKGSDQCLDARFYGYCDDVIKVNIM